LATETSAQKALPPQPLALAGYALGCPVPLGRPPPERCALQLVVQRRAPHAVAPQEELPRHPPLSSVVPDWLRLMMLMWELHPGVCDRQLVVGQVH